MNTFQHNAKIRKQILDSYSNAPKQDGEAQRFSKSEAATLNEMIEKGEISDALASGYGAGSEPFTFTKTGKEIKAQFPAVVAALEAQKVVIEAQLSALQVQAGIVPDVPNSRRYEKTVPFLRYAWEVAEPKYVNGNYEDKTDQNVACSKYNTLIYIYNDILDDLDAIKIISENADDSKKYNLSVSQLIALNFK